jgi:hypothetical protein
MYLHFEHSLKLPFKWNVDFPQPGQDAPRPILLAIILFSRAVDSLVGPDRDRVAGAHEINTVNIVQTKSEYR